MSPVDLDHEHSGPECEICRHRRPFEMPAEIVDACIAGRLVLFAGAGISTESRIVMQRSLYEEIASELGREGDDLPFPELMGAFAETHGRRVLLQRIVRRLDYVDSFPEMWASATRFHRALATLFYVSDIVTTNWDPYFEQEAGAIPLVTADDYALWDLPGRKVFKIHGSRFNLGSIVATARDYERCYRALSRNVLGATLKHLLATKTVVFVGYSFGDPDFQRIYRFMQRQMPEVLPRSYVVTIDEHLEHGLADARVIRTDATYFVERLKDEIVPHGCLLSDDRFDAVTPALREIRARHFELYDAVDFDRYPAAVLCAQYQDGVIHAFERMLERRRSGEYSHICEVQRLCSYYEGLRRERVRAKQYHDAAYIEGYQFGLLYLLADDALRKSFPWYFVYGSKALIRSPTALKRELRRAPVMHRQAYAFAKRIAQWQRGGLVYHHRPELL